VELGTENRVIPCFSVGDLDAALAVICARDSSVKPEFDSGHDEGYRLARIRDPEGNLIQLYWLKPR
jgi:predicted enzyme related to lactoylglutathione lyase